MRPADKIENAVKKMHFKAGPEIDQRLWAEASRAQEESRKVRLAHAKPEIWRTIMRSKVTRFAVAALVVAGVLAGIRFFGGSVENAAFAEVIQKVTSAESVVFFFKQRLGNQPIFAFKTYLQADKMRSELVEVQGQQEGVQELRSQMQQRDLKGVLTIIADIKQAQYLQLDHVRKTAMRAKIHDRVASELAGSNLIDQFRKIKTENAQWLRDETQDGRKIDVYLVTKVDFMGIKGNLSGHETDRMTVWVDRSTGLPVRVLLETSFHSEGKSNDFLDFYQFTWNDPLDPDFFALEVPEGYTLTELPLPRGLESGQP